MRQIPSHLDELQAAVARGPLVVYCHHGVRSMAVAEWLAERGLAGILNLQGGIDAWSSEVDPGAAVLSSLTRLSEAIAPLVALVLEIGLRLWYQPC